MATLLRIHVDGEASLLEEATTMLREADIEIKPTISTRGDPITVSDVLVAVGTSGGFAAFSQIICKILERNKDVSVTIERKGSKVSVTGKMPDVKEILEKFAPPELREEKPKRAQR